MSGITVIGALTFDVVDGSSPRPGGCPTFAVPALEHLGEKGTVIARCAPGDWPALAPAVSSTIVNVDILPAARTARFELRHVGERRELVIGVPPEPWATDATLHALPSDTTWVHLGPLARDEFPADLVNQLARGRRVSFDGQGLVRPARPGPVTPEAKLDHPLVDALTVLKLSENEALALVGEPFGAAAARDLGVPEILLTRGSAGAILFLNGEPLELASTPIAGVDATGAGDTLMTGYVAARARGLAPAEAGRAATALVEEILTARVANSLSR